MILQDLSNPEASNELRELLEELYGEDISLEELIDSTFITRQAKIKLIVKDNRKIGYLIWFLESEKEEEMAETIETLIVDEIVILKDYHNKEIATELIGDIDRIANKNKVSNIEITLPSQSFWLIPSFIDEGGYSSSMLRVSKELAKKTEFIQIYNIIEKSIKPELIELMVSKGDTFQLEIIEEPKDYRGVIEGGFTPEIVSMLFYIEDVDMEKTLERINSITEWQEYTFSLIKRIEN